MRARNEHAGTMSVAEAAPEHVEDETTEKLPPEETKGSPAKLNKDSEVKVRGKSIRISEFLKHFDPECPRRCKDGVAKIGRPNKMSPGGILWVPELCDCTVKGWLAANPAPVTAGSLATAAIERAEAPTPAVPPENPRGKQVKRLRERVSDLRTKLGEIESELGAAIGPLAEDLEREIRSATDLRSVKADVDSKLLFVREQITAAQAEEKSLLAKAEAAQVKLDQATVRADGIRQQMESVRSTRRRDTRPLEKDIGKVEGRINRILQRHPEAAVD